MKFLDFSPPPSPSLNDQQDALQKGLGRAVLWAKSGQLADEPLLNACLHDRRFDMQCEDNRGEWLWGILNSSGMIGRFRQPILEAVKAGRSDEDAYQLCELAFHYARAGDDEFKIALHHIVEQEPNSESPWIVERQLLELDGVEALRLIARIRGKLLESREWDWDDAAIVDRAIEILGEPSVDHLLNDSSDPDICRFAERWKRGQMRSPKTDADGYTERMRSIPASDVIEAAYGVDKAFSFWGWGMHATDGDLETILHVLWSVREPEILVRLLKVFSNRALPRFDARLIDLCHHGNEEVRRWAYNALEANSDPLIREFALEQLRKGNEERSAIGLLVKNFAAGDEQLLLDSVELPEDACLRHWMLIDVLQLLEQNASVDCSRLAMIAYAETPCELCRFRAVELLVNEGLAPAWMIEECRHDSSEECRAFIEAGPQEDPGVGHSPQMT